MYSHSNTMASNQRKTKFNKGYVRTHTTEITEIPCTRDWHLKSSAAKVMKWWISTYLNGTESGCMCRNSIFSTSYNFSTLILLVLWSNAWLISEKSCRKLVVSHIVLDGSQKVTVVFWFICEHTAHNKHKSYMLYSVCMWHNSRLQKHFLKILVPPPNSRSLDKDWKRTGNILL
jgi:hypothetical protein